MISSEVVVQFSMSVSSCVTDLPTTLYGELVTGSGVVG